MTPTCQPIAPDSAVVPKLVDLDDQADWVKSLRRVREQIADLTAMEEQILALLKERIGDADEGQIRGETVITFRWSKPTRRLDLPRLRREAPGVWQAYSMPKAPVRRFVLIPVDEP